MHKNQINKIENKTLFYLGPAQTSIAARDARAHTRVSSARQRGSAHDGPSSNTGGIPRADKRAPPVRDTGQGSGSGERFLAAGDDSGEPEGTGMLTSTVRI